MAIMAQVNTMHAHGAHHAELSRRFAQCALDEYFAALELQIGQVPLLASPKEENK